MLIKPSGWLTLASVLIPIPASRIDKLWPQVKDMVQSVVDSTNGRMQLMDAYKHFLEKDWVLWVSVNNKNIEAIAITEVLQYMRKKMCHVKGMTGKNYANWVGLEEGIAEWAKSIGCHGMEANARKGWVKIFKQYKPTHVFLERMF